MRGRTHIWFSQMFNSGLDPEFLDKMNKAIDQPSDFDMVMARVAGNRRPFMPGLWKGGHRQFNHDFYTGLMKAMMIGGNQGMEAWLYHIMADSMSDQLNKSLGSDMRDAMESMILHMNKVPKYNFD